MLEFKLRSCLTAVVLFVTPLCTGAAAAFDVGEVVVVRENTQAMRGRNTPVPIASGVRFEVRDAKNGWLLGEFEVEGQKVLGWMRNTAVESASKFASSEVIRDEDLHRQLERRKPEVESLGMALAYSVSVDRTTLAFVGKEEPARIKVVDVATGKVRQVIDIPDSKPATSVEIFNESGRLVALTETRVIAWNLDPKPQLVFSVERRDSPGGSAQTILSKNGRTAVVGHGAGDEATIWDDAGNVIATFAAREADPIRVAMGPTARAMVVFYAQGAQCWQEGEDVTFIDGDSILDVAVTLDGQHAAIRTSSGIMVWQLEPLRVCDRLRADNIVGLHLSRNRPLMFTPRNPGGQLEVSRIGADGKITHVNTLDAFWGLPIASDLAGERVVYVSKNKDRKWTMLVTSTKDKTWQILRQFRSPDGHQIEKPNAIQISSGAKTVASSTPRGCVAVWDVESGHVLWQQTIADLTDIWLHPSGNTVLVRQGSGKLSLYRPRDWGVTATRLTFGSDADGWRKKFIDLKQLHFSRSGGQLVAVTSAKKSPVAFYSTRTGELRHSNGFKATRVEFTSNDDRLFMIGRNGAAFCDSLSGYVEKSKDYRLGASWRPGERAVSGYITENRKKSKVLFGPRSGLAISKIEPTVVSTSGLNASSQDGALQAFVGSCLHRRGYGLEVFDVVSGQTIAGFPLEIDSYVGIEFTPDSRYVLIGTSGGVVKVDYRKRESNLLLSMRRERMFRLPRGGSVAAAAILGTATQLGYSGNETRIVDRIRSMDVSANGWLFTGHDSGTVAVWDQATGERILNIANPPDPIDVLAVAQDGHWLACGPEEGGVAYLLDLRRRLPEKEAIPVEEDAPEEPTELTLRF